MTAEKIVASLLSSVVLEIRQASSFGEAWYLILRPNYRVGEYPPGEILSHVSIRPARI